MRETPTTTLRPTGPATSAGALEGHPAQPPYSVTATRDGGVMTLEIGNGTRTVGGGTLNLLPADALDAAAGLRGLSEWVGVVHIDGDPWKCHGTRKGVLTFSDPGGKQGS